MIIHYKVEICDDTGTVLQSGEFTVANETASDGTLRIESMKFGTAIENNELAGEAELFSAATEKVYCWLKVTGGMGQNIRVKWYHENSPAGETTLELKSNSMRTYAFKTVIGAKGRWRAEVIGPAGSVIQAATFTLK